MKVFGIGLSRTGTTSLSVAISILGWRAKHFPKIEMHRKQLRIAHDDLLNFDAVFDTPVAVSYKELDHLYPRSKFILTTRDMEEWLTSCERYPRFSRDVPISPEIQTLRMSLYGCLHYDSASFAEAYMRHVQDVDNYFVSRQDDLLEMDICNGDGWTTLCPFLQVSIPPSPFPHENRHSHS